MFYDPESPYYQWQCIEEYFAFSVHKIFLEFIRSYDKYSDGTPAEDLLISLFNEDDDVPPYAAIGLLDAFKCYSVEEFLPHFLELKGFDKEIWDYYWEHGLDEQFKPEYCIN